MLLLPGGKKHARQQAPTKQAERALPLRRAHASHALRFSVVRVRRRGACACATCGLPLPACGTISAYSRARYWSVSGK